MQFQPINEKAYAERGLVAAGWYPVTIAGVEEGASKKTGNQYLKLLVDTHLPNGNTARIYSYVMAEGMAAWQLRAAAQVFDVLDKYKSGTLEAYDLQGKTGYAKVAIEEDKSGVYAPKNVIKEFGVKIPEKALKAQETQAQAAAQVAKDKVELDDEIPF